MQAITACKTAALQNTLHMLSHLALAGRLVNYTIYNSGDSFAGMQVQGSPPGYDINYVLFGLTGKQAAERMQDGKVYDK